MSNLVIDCKSVGKTYQEGSLSVDVLVSVTLQVEQGERVAILGASGSGKSTLLNILGGLDKPSTGSTRLNGTDFAAMGEAAKGRFRNAHLGFIYQFHHLLPEFSALENVAMPLLIGGASVASAKKQATDILSSVGLSKRFHHKPGELSGGERQRAAVARALVTHPKCLLADEPTGNLDPRIAEQVFQVLLEMNRNRNTSIVMVTHDHGLAKRMDRVLSLEEGRLVAWQGE